MLKVLCSISSISVFISSMLVMIGHVREIKHVLICCANIRGFFESRYYINTVGDVDWVCLAPDGKVWKAPLNILMSLQVV